MKNIECIKNFIQKNDIKGLAKFLYQENLRFCDGSNEMCEVKYLNKDACKNCQINDISDWLEDKPCTEYKEDLVEQILTVEDKAKDILNDLYKCEGFNSESSGLCIVIQESLANRILSLLNNVQDTEKEDIARNKSGYTARYLKGIIADKQNPDFDFVLLTEENMKDLIDYIDKLI